MRPPTPPRAPQRSEAIPAPPAPSASATPSAPPAPIAAVTPIATVPENVAITMTARIEERHRAERLARTRRVAIIAGSAVAAGALGWSAFFSPIFALDAASAQIDLTGDGVTDTMIRDVLVAYDGVPLTRLRTSTLEARIVEAGGVADAAVARQWPRSLQVVVTAREPVAAVSVQGGFQLYDTAGVPLNVVEAAPEGLPVISTAIDDNTPATIGAILSVLGQIPVDLRAEIATISATSEQTITFTLDDGATVKWGDATESDLKAAVLQTLRQVGASTYDLSAPRSPVTS